MDDEVFQMILNVKISKTNLKLMGYNNIVN
jgi:hypothetical protein